MVDALTSPETINDVVFFVQVVFWNYQRDMLAECLFSRLAQNPFCGSIPTRNDAIKILANDYVVRRIYN